MTKIEKLIKGYSSTKLKEIIGQQSSSYSESFIDYAKDELIKRGENFLFNPKLENEVAAMNDKDLKNLIEKEWNNFHLEYIEIARIEYLKRNFKNESIDIETEEEFKKDGEKRYPAMRTIAGIYYVLALIGGITVLYLTIKAYNIDTLNALKTFLFGVIMVISLLAVSESIKVWIDIEENTRKVND